VQELRPRLLDCSFLDQPAIFMRPFILVDQPAEDLEAPFCSPASARREMITDAALALA
jgi:hypothetical protein